MCPATNSITIPESVRFFFSDNNHTLVTEFDRSITPPPPFDIHEVVSFFQAKRNAALCKMDLFQFMAEAYQKIWLPALDGRFSLQKVQDLSLANVNDIFSHTAIWKDRFHALSWDFASNRIKGAQLRASCYVSGIANDFKFCACLYVYMPVIGWVDEAPHKMHLNDCWEQNDAENSEYCLKKEFCPPISGKASLDLSDLAEKAARALKAVNRYLSAQDDS